MDPNATLAEIRELVAEIHNEPLTTEQLADRASSLAEKTEALDEWISKGGFLPEAWQRA